jgi:hypothetical protein
VPEFRITYTIERRDSNGDWAEIGFGSSAGDATLDAALYHVQSDIQNRQWETSGDMPEPEEVDG